MKEGDTVRLRSAPEITAVVVKMPRMIGRKNRRVLVRDDDGLERWLGLDELEAIPEPR